MSRNCAYQVSCPKKCRNTAGCSQYKEALEYCLRCGAGIVFGDLYYDCYGELYCPDCMEEEIKEWKAEHLTEAN